MPAKQTIKIGPLKESELPEAQRIVQLAFGTFLGLPNPRDFMGDRNLMTPRWHSSNVKVLAARDGSRLLGTNVITRWGSFGFFGPLTILPEYWNKGVAQKLLEATMKVFESWHLRHTGLFTFSNSAKHVGLYQKFGYWPQYLTALMNFTPEQREATQAAGADAPTLLSSLAKVERENAIVACAKLCNAIQRGLDLGGEIRSALSQRVGDVVLTYTGRTLDGFAVCMNGVGSEGGEKICYIKFGAARGGKGAGKRFTELLSACEAFAASRGATLEAGVNLAREDAFCRMRARGFRVTAQGVAMQKPHTPGFNRADAYVIDDWR